MSPPPLRWAIYARQSLDRTGAGLAVERQIADCRELGKKLKLAGEPIIYQDNDISASSGKRRPAYQQLLAALGAGEHRALIVWHTDRLHRRPLELEEFIAVAERHKVVTHTVRAGELDLATPSGRMVARMLGAAARQEVEHKADRRARAIRQGAEAGKRHGGSRSFGYGRTLVDEDGRCRAVDIHRLNKREAAAIRAAFETILHGRSTTSVWKGWNERGLTTQHGGKWNGTNFGAMIKRPSLAGLVTYKGEVLEGVEAQWPAIVPLDKWRAVQAIVTDPARRTSPGNTPKHLCSGVTYCECGLPMRAGTNSIKSKRTGVAQRYTVYRCAAGEAGHSTILKHVLDAAVRDAVIDALYEAKDAPPQPVSDDDGAALVELNTELEAVRQREERLAGAIADGLVTLSSARKTSDQIKADQIRITEALERLTRQVATVGMDEAAWEALWAGIDANAPTFTKNPSGGRTFHPGRAVIKAMMAEGMTEAEAKAKFELGRRFDDLPLEQQRATVRATLRVTIHRGRSSDRVVTTRGTAPAVR